MVNLFEKCLERVDGCVQEVVDAWALNFPANYTPEFKVVFDRACEYRTARQTAENHREFNVLTEQEAACERTTREAFCKEYVAFLNQHPELVAR